MCNIVEEYANEKAEEAFKQGFEEGLEKSNFIRFFIEGYISYEDALEQIGDKELLDRLIRKWDPDFVKLTSAERASLKEACAEAARGEYSSHDEVWADINRDCSSGSDIEN